jgi:hypothetical protein
MKMVCILDMNERASEIMKLFRKLQEMNLGIMGYEEIGKFRTICNTYIKDGNHVKGKILLPGTKRIIVYDFHNKVDCMLKYDENV